MQRYGKKSVFTKKRFVFKQINIRNQPKNKAPILRSRLVIVIPGLDPESRKHHY